MTKLPNVRLSETPFRDLYQNLEATFKQVAKANLSLQPAKCAFAKNEIEYLGHIVSDKGIAPQMSKIKIIRPFPEPKNRKEVSIVYTLILHQV